MFDSYAVRLSEWKRNAKSAISKTVSILQAYAIGFPHIKFKLTNITGKHTTILSTSGSSDSAQVFMEIFGLNPKFLDFSECSSGDRYVVKCRVGKFTSPSRSSLDRQFFFVNGRPSDQPFIQKAINLAYRERGYTGYPPFAIFIDVAPGQFDVNLSPDKRKVKLLDEKDICQSILDMLASCCLQVSEGVSASQNSALSVLLGSSLSTRSQEKPSSQNGEIIKSPPAPLSLNPGKATGTLGIETLPLSKSEFKQMRILGQFNCGFILASLWRESQEYIYIVDQHAADERFQLETLKSNLKPSVQRLILPKCFSVSSEDNLFISDHISEFIELGFGLLKADKDKVDGWDFKLEHVPQIAGINLDLSGMKFFIYSY